MQGLILVVIVGLVAGFSIALQSPLTAMIGQRLGVLESVVIIHLGGLIAAGVPLLARGGGNLGEWRSLPWYALIAGVSGLIVLGAVNYVYPRLGATSTTFLIVTGQLVVSVVMDHFGLLGTEVRLIDLSRVLGIIVLFIGVWLIAR
jgi:transporter family-2 protein